MSVEKAEVDFSSFHSLFLSILSSHGYEYISEIGVGGQAVVYLCRNERDLELYAVKIMRATDSASVPAELRALQSVWNPHVINVYDSYIESDFRFLTLEYCPGGSLFDMLSEGPLPMDVLWPLAKQIVGALNACHTHGVAHLDIKPQNILIDKHGRAKLCDFGIAVMGEHSNQFKGSIAFLAPEILRRMDYYDPFKADVWSLGVTLHVLATGKLPWPENLKEFFEAVAKGLGQVDARVPDDFVALLRKMIVPDPAERARLADIMEAFERGARPDIVGLKRARMARSALLSPGSPIFTPRRGVGTGPASPTEEPRQLRSMRSMRPNRSMREVGKNLAVPRPRPRMTI
jgi:serine/threonine protein kinase